MLKSKVYFSDGKPSPAVGVIEEDAITFRITDSKPTIRPPSPSRTRKPTCYGDPDVCKEIVGTGLWTALSRLCASQTGRQHLAWQRRVHAVSLMTAEEQNSRERRRASIVAMLRGYTTASKGVTPMALKAEYLDLTGEPYRTTEEEAESAASQNKESKAEQREREWEEALTAAAQKAGSR